MTKSSRRVEVGPVGKVALGMLGIVQVTLAALAFWNLYHQDASDVRGPKPAWIPVILVNWIGPAAYFLFGIKHRRR